MNTGDVLAARIRQCVAALVPADQVDRTTLAVGQALQIILNDPAFYNDLRIVHQLAEENQWLKSQVVQLQRALGLATSAQVVKRPRKRSPAKAATTNKKAFTQGYRQARKT